MDGKKVIDYTGKFERALIDAIINEDNPNHIELPDGDEDFMVELLTGLSLGSLMALQKVSREKGDFISTLCFMQRLIFQYCLERKTGTAKRRGGGGKMSANLIYYPGGASMQMAPGLDQTKFLAGFDHANTMVNVMIGVANEVARVAIDGGMDALQKSRWWRHDVKRLAKETFRRQERYERRHSQNFGERTQMWYDYLDAVQEEYEKPIFDVYMALKQAMDKGRQSESHLKAKLECGRVCAMLAVSQFRC